MPAASGDSTLHAPNGPLKPAGAPATQERQARLVTRWLTTVTIALGAVYCAFFAYHAALTIAFPYDLDWGEGYVLNDAVRLARGEQIYVDIQRFPMVRSPYPPLFLAVNAVLLQVSGVGFFAGRLLSTLAAIGCAALTYRVARASGATAATGWIAALVVLASPHLYQWAPYSRVDTLAVAFSLLAVLLASGGAGPRRLVLAGVVTAAALLTKQTVLAAPLAIVAWLALTRWRDLRWYLIGAVLPGLLVGALLIASSDGQFIRHVVTGNAGNPTNLARLVRFQAEFSLLHPLLLVAALGYAFTELRRGRPTLLALAALFAWLLSFSVASEASSVNYFLELLPFAAAAGAVGLTHLARPAPGRAVLGAGLALLQMVMLFHVPNLVGVWPSFFAPHGYTPTAQDALVGREIDALVAGTSGWVLSEPAGFALRNDREVLVQPLDLRAEQLRGRWDSAPLRQAVRERRFALIVLSYGLFPNDVLAEIRQHYALHTTLQSPNGLRYSVYRPAS